MIIILDLDETLVHTSNKKIEGLDYFTYTDEYIIHKRPYLDVFIKKLITDDYYDFAVWSAGTYDYVHHIVNTIFPKDIDLAFVLTRNDCNENRDKPLWKARTLYNETYRGNKKAIMSGSDEPVDVYLEPKSIHDFILIDDREYVTCYDTLNHLRIKSFEGSTRDTELKRLWEYLESNKGKCSEELAAEWST